MRDAEDVTILDFAHRESRVSITRTTTFLKSSGSRGRFCAVLFCSGSNECLRGKHLADLIVGLWQDYEVALQLGCVLKVSSRGAKVRLLPLNS